MNKKRIDVSALCLSSKLNIDEGDRARIEAELCEFADFAAVLDDFAAHDMGVCAVVEGELRADTPKNETPSLPGGYVTVPLTVKEARDE